MARSKTMRPPRQSKGVAATATERSNAGNTDGLAPRRSPMARPRAAEADFPGCRPVRLTAQTFATFDGRFEYWDEASETAWMVRDSPIHEGEASSLSFLICRISVLRGMPIRCYRTMDMMRRGPDGQREVMQADETIYMHPGHASLPGREAMVVGENDCPDVVLEVDHTTDTRRRKLAKYAEWGFPEVWVEVPDRPAPSRPASRRSGLTIYLLEPGGQGPGYVVARASRAFPSWASAEIHEAINEGALSRRTSAILERVGRTLGERDGTVPEDDPTAGFLMTSARAEGRVEGRAEGLIEGRATAVEEVLIARGIEVSPGFAADMAAFVGASQGALVAAALACDDENDFRRRIVDL